MELNQIIWGDCLDVMPYIPSGSVDLILCDLPYGITKCRWDSVIPLEPLWQEYKRVIKPQGAILLTAVQPFTSTLVTSNPKWFRQELIWDKKNPAGHLNAKIRHLPRHESVLVFSKGRATYNPQMRQGAYRKIASPKKNNESYGSQRHVARYSDLRYPTSILEFSNAVQLGKIHPTQKPVALFEYLIKTYSNPGETVLDNAAGSCTTAIAALNTGRNFICIEKEEKYVRAGRERIENARLELERAA